MAQFLQIPANDKVVSVAGFVQSRKSRIWQMSEKLLCHDKIVKVASKNCDKFITPTVRVSICAYFKTVPMRGICHDK